MKASTIKYFIIDAMKNLKRNKTSTIASILTVSASLILMGIFLLTISNVNQGLQSVESKIEIRVVLKDDITDEQKSDLENTITNDENVKEVRFETKEEALEKWKEDLGEENEELTQGLENDNPMPNSFIVKVKNPDNVSEVIENIKDKPGIDVIKAGKDVINKIVAITNALKWIGFVLFFICFVVALFLIVNTIKLTVFSRRREINIMKYVGATDWFIRWPFIIEGIMIGMIGGLISILLLYYIYNGVYYRFSSGLVSMLLKLISPKYVLYNMGWKFLLGGIAIGGLGSCFSIRKFLQV